MAHNKIFVFFSVSQPTGFRGAEGGVFLFVCIHRLLIIYPCTVSMPSVVTFASKQYSGHKYRKQLHINMNPNSSLYFRLERYATTVCGRSGRHPTAGVALFGPKVSDQLSSLNEELPTRKNISLLRGTIVNRTYDIRKNLYI